jgi:hypothetical protein
VQGEKWLQRSRQRQKWRRDHPCRQKEREEETDEHFPAYHDDIYSLTIAISGLTGFITWILVALNPVR